MSNPFPYIHHIVPPDFPRHVRDKYAYLGSRTTTMGLAAYPRIFHRPKRKKQAMLYTAVFINLFIFLTMLLSKSEDFRAKRIERKKCLRYCIDLCSPDDGHSYKGIKKPAPSIRAKPAFYFFFIKLPYFSKSKFRDSPSAPFAVPPSSESVSCGRKSPRLDLITSAYPFRLLIKPS